MITMFNQEELCITTSMRAQSEIRAILKQNDIPYKVDSEDFSTQTYGHTMRVNRPLVYKIYVKKKDYVAAQNLIRAVRLHD